MKDIVYKLYYNQFPNSNVSQGFMAFLLFFIFIIIIILLSFNITKSYLGKHWESHRCEYIFMSGYLQPDTSIKPHDYTLDNLKYCIKQNIYNDTPILPYIQELFKKIKYLITFIQKQIGFYETYIKTEVETKTQKHKDINMNKINYLKHKQKNLQTIYNKLDGLFKETSDKIKMGVDNKITLENENKLNKKYLSDRYYDYSSK